MSTILKALRRLEDEKAAAAPRELRQQLAGPPSPRSRLRRWLPLAGLALLLGVGLGWWSWPRDEAPPSEPDVAQQSPPPAPAPEQATRPRPSPESRREARAERRAALEQLKLPELPERPAREREKPAQRAARAQPGMPDEAFASPVEVVARPAARPRIPLEEPAAPVREEQDTPVADPFAEPAFEFEPEPEPVAVAPQPARAPEPTLSVRVDKTLWHPRPERREALVAVDGGPPTRVREGEVVAGARVKEIEPTGVVFERAGESLHRRVGEP